MPFMQEKKYSIPFGRAFVIIAVFALVLALWIQFPVLTLGACAGVISGLILTKFING